MVRLALALAAILILALSAGLTHSQPHTAALVAGASSAASMHGNTDALHADLLLIKHTALVQTAPSPVNQAEPPAPALLVYLGLILVGSAGSVALARWRLHRKP
jgi:hypothetical protein